MTRYRSWGLILAFSAGLSVAAGAGIPPIQKEIDEAKKKKADTPAPDAPKEPKWDLSKEFTQKWVTTVEQVVTVKKSAESGEAPLKITSVVEMDVRWTKDAAEARAGEQKMKLKFEKIVITTSSAKAADGADKVEAKIDSSDVKDSKTDAAMAAKALHGKEVTVTFATADMTAKVDVPDALAKDAAVARFVTAESLARTIAAAFPKLPAAADAKEPAPVTITDKAGTYTAKAAWSQTKADAGKVTYEAKGSWSFKPAAAGDGAKPKVAVEAYEVPLKGTMTFDTAKGLAEVVEITAKPDDAAKPQVVKVTGDDGKETTVDVRTTYTQKITTK